MTKPVIEVERCSIEEIRDDRLVYGISSSHVCPPKPMYRARLDLLLDDAGREILEALIRAGFKPKAPEQGPPALPQGPLVAEFDEAP